MPAGSSSSSSSSKLAHSSKSARKGGGDFYIFSVQVVATGVAATSVRYRGGVSRRRWVDVLGLGLVVRIFSPERRLVNHLMEPLMFL